MSDDTPADTVDHEIRAWELVAEDRVYRVREDDGLELDFTGKVKDCHSRDRSMFYCICNPGRGFRKEETAIDHLREVGALDD